MEKYQQANRNNGIVRTGLWDDTFAASTLQRREPVATRNATSTRNTRVTDQKSSQSRKRGSMSDEDEDSSSSTDEIDMLRPSQAAKKTALQNKLGTRPKVNQKNKSFFKNNLSDQKDPLPDVFTRFTVALVFYYNQSTNHARIRRIHSRRYGLWCRC